MPQLPELKLPDQVAAAGELPQQVNQEALEQQLSGAVRNTAQKQLADQQGKLNQVGAEPGQYQERFKKLGSVKDLPKDALKLQPYNEKPWQEHVVLGSLWQFGHQERYNIDLGPSLAWRFTEKLSAGAGFQYRLSVSVKEKPWLGSPDKVLGYFAFSDYEVKKGFFGRLHYEDLNTPVPRLDAAVKVEEVGQEWVKGLSVGIGKNYTFYKRLQCYTLVQYNVLHEPRKTPYLRPLQARIGFYINGRRGKAKEADMETK